jgi:hypothetical protein
VYRVDAVRDVEGWDETLPVNEDVDIDRRILGLGHRIRYDPDMVIRWQVRESLRDFGRQYRRYGRGKAAMIRKNGPRAIRARHLAAPGLVVVLAAAAVLVAAGRPLAAALAAGPYALAVAAATAVTAVRTPGRRWRAPDLAAAFVVMHLGWGLGFLEGMVVKRRAHDSSARLPAGATPIG